jgi:hypothetical protein
MSSVSSSGFCDGPVGASSSTLRAFADPHDLALRGQRRARTRGAQHRDLRLGVDALVERHRQRERVPHRRPIHQQQCLARHDDEDVPTTTPTASTAPTSVASCFFPSLHRRAPAVVIAEAGQSRAPLRLADASRSQKADRTRQSAEHLPFPAQPEHALTSAVELRRLARRLPVAAPEFTSPLPPFCRVRGSVLRHRSPSHQ